VRCVRAAGERFCRGPFGARAGDGQPDGEVVPWASHSLAFMTELVELQHWRCPWCGDCLPDSPRGTAIDHIILRVYGGPHRRWNLQLLHQMALQARDVQLRRSGGLTRIACPAGTGLLKSGRSAVRPRP
jgi:hypothetical protein